MQKLNEELTNDILEKQLGKLGARAGAIGGFAGGGLLSSLGGALGGYAGPKWMASRLRTIEYKESMELSCPPEKAIKNATSVLVTMPHFIEWLHDADQSAVPFLAALVGSGFGGMNPTVVCLEFIPIDDGNTNVHIAAKAKEGLINQKSAEKAVKNIRKLLHMEIHT